MSARSLGFWRITAFCGIFLVTIGTAYFFFDEATTDRFGSSSLVDIFGMGAVLGVPIAFIGLVGWAKQLGRKGRIQMAASVFFAPWLLLFPGYLIDGMNIHGSAGPVMFLMLIAAILAVVLLIMSEAANRK
jgi:ABC-type transport system involved in cytochrome c biogenesis permease subunit